MAHANQVIILFSNYILRVTAQSRTFFGLEQRGYLSEPAGAGELSPDQQSEIRVQQGKELLAELHADQAPEKLVAEVVHGVQIAVGEQHPEAVILQAERVIVNLDFKIISEKIIEPEIVVAADQNQPATVFTNLRQAVENGKVLLYDGIFPVEPEVEDIAVEHHQVVFSHCLFQKVERQIGVGTVVSVFEHVFVMHVRQHADAHLNPG